ncbi:MAG: hypothetical protein GEU90_19705 [Gemmatimonas sp.]|nr:hypothetical protein [Gemmatimonas sp.]
MAAFGRDYDESYRSGTWSDRGSWGGQNMPGWRGGENQGGYGAAAPGWRSQDPFGADRYMSDYDTRPGPAYDRGYKGRWQTDYGDPFGDRQYHSPMRTRGGYDRGYGSSDRGGGYPMGYRPYSARAGYDTGFRTNRGYGRGYDRGWY